MGDEVGLTKIRWLTSKITEGWVGHEKSDNLSQLSGVVKSLSKLVQVAKLIQDTAAVRLSRAQVSFMIGNWPPTHPLG